MGRVDVYTKIEYADLIGKLAEPKNGDSVVDMAVGTGNLLLGIVKNVQNPKTLKLFGFDIDKKVLDESKKALSEFNYTVELKDSFEFFKDKKDAFDISVLNPPWNVRATKEMLKDFSIKERVLYNDWLWMLISSNIARKKSVVIESQSVLSRVKGEIKLRQKIVEMNIIEAVIILPNDAFENAKLDSAIIVFDKNKKDDNVLFVDGRKIEKNKIFEIVKNKEEIAGISKVVNLDEIKKNKSNLNPLIYLNSQNTGTKIKDLFEIKTNGIKPIVFTQRKNNSIPWLTIKDIKKYDGKEIENCRYFVSIDEIRKKHIRAVPKGSLIIAGRATIGNIAIAKEYSAFDRGCIALIPKNKNIKPKVYIETIKQAINNNKNSMPGTTYKSLAKKYIEDLSID
jgi:type I restriction-modification system DNA methylase subunit